jgi:hypothetical protein
MISDLSIQFCILVPQLITLPLYLRTSAAALERMARREPVRSQGRGKGFLGTDEDVAWPAIRVTLLACLFRGSGSTASNQAHRSAFRLSVTFSENRFAFFGITLPKRRNSPVRRRGGASLCRETAS